ncbi:MAG TPA: hypothetical protein VFA74_15860 [Terriglobales bacterium]|nr:hypothetical protein [Terriglobales bacterium]
MACAPRGVEPHSPKAVSPEKYPWPFATDHVIAGGMSGNGRLRSTVEGAAAYATQRA